MDRLAFLRLVTGVGGSAALRPATAMYLQAGQPSSPGDDDYAIWSLLIPLLQPTSRGYLIPALTTVFRVMTQERSIPPLTAIERAKRGGQLIEVDVPGAMEAKFREAVADQQAAPGEVVLLERKLQLPHPYRLLSQGQVEEYGRLTPPACVIDPSHPWHRDRALERKYVGYSSPCLFSRVCFDRSRSLGLVWAGGGGHDGLWITGIYIFGRGGDAWHLLDWHASSVAVYC